MCHAIYKLLWALYSLFSSTFEMEDVITVSNIKIIFFLWCEELGKFIIKTSYSGESGNASTKKLSISEGTAWICISSKRCRSQHLNRWICIQTLHEVIKTQLRWFTIKYYKLLYIYRVDCATSWKIDDRCRNQIN